MKMGIINETNKLEYERLLKYIEHKLSEPETFIPHPSSHFNDCASAARTRAARTGNIAYIALEGLLVELDVPVGKRYCYSQALEELYGLIGNPYCSDVALEKIVNDYLADSG